MPLLKNVAGQNVTFNLVAVTGSSDFTSGTGLAGKYTIDNGPQGTCGGTFTNKGGGQYNYAPTQAETNGTDIGFKFSATGAISVNLDFHTDKAVAALNDAGPAPTAADNAAAILPALQAASYLNQSFSLISPLGGAFRILVNGTYTSFLNYNCAASDIQAAFAAAGFTTVVTQTDTYTFSIAFTSSVAIQPIQIDCVNGGLCATPTGTRSVTYVGPNEVYLFLTGGPFLGGELDLSFEFSNFVIPGNYINSVQNALSYLPQIFDQTSGIATVTGDFNTYFDVQTVFSVETPVSITNDTLTVVGTATVDPGEPIYLPGVALAASQPNYAPTTAAALSGLATTAQLASATSTINNNIALISTNGRLCIVVIPTEFYIPATGNAVYWVDVYLQDATETPIDPDSNTITVHASLMDGTVMDARLVHADGTNPGATVIARIATGHYRAYVLVQSTDTPQPVAFAGTYAVSAVTKNFGGVVDLDYAIEQATLNAVKAQTDKIGTNAADSPNAVTAQSTIATNLDAKVSTATTAAGNAATAAGTAASAAGSAATSAAGAQAALGSPASGTTAATGLFAAIGSIDAGGLTDDEANQLAKLSARFCGTQGKVVLTVPTRGSSTLVVYSSDGVTPLFSLPISVNAFTQTIGPAA